MVLDMVRYFASVASARQNESVWGEKIEGKNPLDKIGPAATLRVEVSPRL